MHPERMQIPLSLSVGVRSQPSNVFMVMELAIRITAFVRDPTQVIMKATNRVILSSVGKYLKILPDDNFSFWTNSMSFSWRLSPGINLIVKAFISSADDVIEYCKRFLFEQIVYLLVPIFELCKIITKKNQQKKFTLKNKRSVPTTIRNHRIEFSPLIPIKYFNRIEKLNYVAPSCDEHSTSKTNSRGRRTCALHVWQRLPYVSRFLGLFFAAFLLG